MRNYPSFGERHTIRRIATLLVFALVAGVPFQSAYGLIIGGEGNRPIHDPGWPSGAAAIFNHSARLAFWEGPPFGGGQWHAECRGDVQSFNSILADFAALETGNKRLVVRDGIRASFWLNRNQQPEKRETAHIDWRFTVWVPGNWHRLQTMPASINPTDPRDAEAGPPTEIEVYTGGNIRWPDVIVPPGIEVIDKRLEAHGYSLVDGLVLEGQVVDASTKNPIRAQIRLETRPDRRNRPDQKRYQVVLKVSADQEGRWVLKNVPAGSHRIVLDAEGYVPRIAGYIHADDQPGWRRYDRSLSRPAPVSGQITDGVGQPLAEVHVRLSDVVTELDGRYQSPNEYQAMSDSEGRFRVEQIPFGSAKVNAYKPSYCHIGLGPTIATPTDDVALRLIASAGLCITVDFAAAARPGEYIVHLTPEGGEAVGKWSGSSQIDQQNRVSFKDVPPGRYVLSGHPNPTTDTERSDPVTVDLMGGKTIEVTLPAK